MTATYLQSRPGRPLHLSVWAADRTEHQPDHGYYVTDRPVPICSQDRGSGWRFTGPWAERWERDRKGGLCSRCLSVLAELNAAAGDLT